MMMTIIIVKPTHGGDVGEKGAVGDLKGGSIGHVWTLLDLEVIRASSNEFFDTPYSWLRQRRPWSTVCFLLVVPYSRFSRPSFATSSSFSPPFLILHRNPSLALLLAGVRTDILRPRERSSEVVRR